MGGFGGVLRDIAPKAADAIESHTPQLLRAIGEQIAPQVEHFKMSNAGSAIYKAYNEEFRPLLEQNKAQIYDAAKAGKPVMNPHNNTPLLDRKDIEAHASKITRDHVFGSKDEDLAWGLAAVRKEKGDIHANVLSDHLHNMFHDAGYESGPNVGRSRLATNLIKAAKNNQDAFVPKNTAPYRKPQEIESTVKSVARGIFAAKAALPHTASSIITLMKDGAVPYAKALHAVLPFGNYENSRLLLQSTNAISELHSTEYNQHMAYEQSKFKTVLNNNFKFVPNSVGEIIHSNFSMPGMSAVRRWNLTLAGMSSKFHAEELAARIMYAKPGGWEESEFRRLKLDPAKIKAQGGTLTPEDLKTAIFHGVDQSAFIDNPALRASISQSTFAGRITNIYHGYISRSGKAIASAIWDGLSSKNPAQIATIIGTLGLIAPEVGNGIHFLENIARGHKFGDAEKDWATQEKNLHAFTSDGFMQYMSSNVEALANIGAFGVVTGFTRAMARNKLIESMAGPIPNALGNIVEDANKFFLTDNNHPDAWKPLVRDAIEDVPTAGTGGFIAHKLLPTKQEEAEDKPKSAKSQRAAATRARHKKSSNNPLRALFGN